MSVALTTTHENSIFRGVSARLLDRRHEGRFSRYTLHRNLVHQSTSTWWVVRKFLDSMRTG
jgi:hypothetical protein